MKVFRSLFGSAVVLLLASCAVGTLSAPTPNAGATETSFASSLSATQTASVPTATRTPTAIQSPTATNTLVLADGQPPMYAPGSQAPAPTAEEVLTSTLKSGWTLYELPNSKFGIAVPPEWKRLELSPGRLEASITIAGDLDPKFKALFSSQTIRNLVASGIRFYALDASPEAVNASYPTTLNVLRLDIGIALPLDSVVGLNLQQLKNVAEPSVAITHQRVNLSNIEAEEFKYTFRANMASQSVVMMLTQYVTMHGTTEYVVTLAGPEELYKKQAPLFEQIGQTFRVLK